MADYGIRIYHQDGSHFDFTDQATMCRLLGIGQTQNHALAQTTTTFTENTGIRVPEGYDWWLWQTFNVVQNWGVIVPWSAVFSGFGPAGPGQAWAYLDANRVINVRWEYTYIEDRVGDRLVFANFYIPSLLYGAVCWPVAQQYEYGFQIYGVDNLSGVFDTSLVSYLMWKGEIDIYDGWNPAHINPAFTLHNSLCFFYTTDPDAVISIDYNMRYRVWRNGRRTTSPVRARVCIFGNGAPVSPLADYGLEVWNPRTGQRVYNSGRDVLIRPRLVSVQAALTMVNQQLVYDRVTVPGISRPMYAPTNTGAGVSYGVSWNEKGEDMPAYYTWVSSDGYYLYQRAGGEVAVFNEIPPDRRLIRYDNVHYSNAVNPVMVINAEDYFVF